MNITIDVTKSKLVWCNNCELYREFIFNNSLKWDMPVNCSVCKKLLFFIRPEEMMTNV